MADFYWTCPSCTFVNQASTTICSLCGVTSGSKRGRSESGEQRVELSPLIIGGGGGVAAVVSGLSVNPSSSSVRPESPRSQIAMPESPRSKMMTIPESPRSQVGTHRDLTPRSKLPQSADLSRAFPESPRSQGSPHPHRDLSPRSKLPQSLDMSRTLPRDLSPRTRASMSDRTRSLTSPLNPPPFNPLAAPAEDSPMKLHCPFCTIEQASNVFNNVEIQCYMCNKVFPNPLIEDNSLRGIPSRIRQISHIPEPSVSRDISHSISVPSRGHIGGGGSMALDNIKCPKCLGMMLAPQGVSVVQCPRCFLDIRRSPSFDEHVHILPSPAEVSVADASPLSLHMRTPSSPASVDGLEWNVPPPLTPGRGPQPLISLAEANKDLPVIEADLEHDLTPQHRFPLNHPEYGRLGTFRKLKFCYLYCGGLILFIWGLASNAVFLHNVPTIVSQYDSVADLLFACCDRNGGSSNLCCGTNSTCCNCEPWLRAGKDGLCDTAPTGCEEFYDSMIPVPPFGLKTVLSYDPFGKCHSQVLNTHYKCPSEDCLRNPPAIYIYGFNVAYAMLVTSVVLLVISRLFTECTYYKKSYKTEQYHATETILGCFWFCRNKHFQNFILIEKGSYETSCIGYWLSVCVRLDNLVTHIFLAGAYASPYFSSTKFVLAIFSILVDIGQLVLDTLGFFAQCCAKSCKAGEEHVECQCKGRNCAEFSFLIFLVLVSGVVMTTSFVSLYYNVDVGLDYFGIRW